MIVNAADAMVVCRTQDVDLKAGEEEESGKWEETEKGFKVEDEFEVVVDGDKGTMEYSSVTFSFDRK